jgi:hypothetical protein
VINRSSTREGDCTGCSRADALLADPFTSLAGLVLGASSSLLQEDHISSLLPVLGTVPLAALMTEGGLGPLPAGYTTPARSHQQPIKKAFKKSGCLAAIRSVD